MYNEIFFSEKFVLASNEQARDYYKAYTAIVKLFSATDPLQLYYKKGWYKTYADLALQLMAFLPGTKTYQNVLFSLQSVMGSEWLLPFQTVLQLSKEIYAIRDLYVWPPEAY